MKGLKVIPEIFIWLIFAVITGFGYAFSFFGYLESHMQLSVINILIPTFVWLLLAVICTLVLKAAQNTKYEISFSKRESIFLESSVFVLFLIGGWVFRFVDYFHAAWPSETDHTYFLHAMVVQNNELYMNPHPISRIYVSFLNFILKLFGNHYSIGAYAQFALLIIGVLVWYFAIRKSFGIVTSLFFVAGAMLLPDSIKASMQCNPMMLLFVFYGITAWLLVRYVHIESNGFWQYLLAFILGVFVLLALTFDISGVLVSLAYLIALKKKELKDKKKGIKHTVATCFEIFGMLTGAVLFRTVQAVIYDMHFAISGGLNCFSGLKFNIPDLTDLQNFLFGLGAHPIFIVSIAVISVFWFLKNRNVATWIMFSMIVLFVMQFLNLDDYLKHDFIIYIGIVLLLGIAAGQLVNMEKCNITDSETDKEDVVPEEVKEPFVQVVNFDEEPAVVIAEPTTVVEETSVTFHESESASKENEVNSIEAEKPLIYIPKSMEIPKRVSKPKVDYCVEVEDSKLHYDIEVSDNADFDIN